MRVELTIDQLVLNDFSLTATDRAVLRRAVETELARLIAQGAADRALVPGDAQAVQTGPMALPAGTDPAALGVQIAGAIYGGLQTRGDARAPGSQVRGIAPGTRQQQDRNTP